MIRARKIDYDALPVGKMTGYVYDSWVWIFLAVVLVVEHGLDLDEARAVVGSVRETRKLGGAT